MFTWGLVTGMFVGVFIGLVVMCVLTIENDREDRK